MSQLGLCIRGGVYAVRAGESFQSIARELGITVLELADKNPYVDPTNMIEGQILCVPGNWATHIAHYGQAYKDILKRFQMSDEAFRAANPQIDPMRLLPGQRFRVLCRSG